MLRDIAVGAPYDDFGKVFIYHGSKNGINTKPAQVAKPSQVYFGGNIIDESAMKSEDDPGVECSQRIFPGDYASTRQAIASMEQWQGAGPHQCLGEEAVQSQLRSSHRNYDTFGQISRDMLERGHDWNALQCRVKVKELQNAYGKAREANRCSGGAPGTCRFYKELDVILGGDLTSTPRTTIDTSEPSSTRLEEEEEESRSKGAEEAPSASYCLSCKDSSTLYRSALVDHLGGYSCWNTDARTVGIFTLEVKN
ncbi:unnamed protein product [Lepidochelys olivacea]